MKKPRPIEITPELAGRYTEPDQFQKFDGAFRKILTVSHSEIVRREAVQKERAALNPRKRGPKPKAVYHGPAVQPPV